MPIDAQNIIRITEAGLTYTDENGQEQFIDFSVCYANYWARFTEKEHLQRFQQMNNMNDEELAVWLKKHEAWKEVAQRDITGWSAEIDHSFIQFHTTPPVQFTFATDNEDKYRWVMGEIWKFGWRVFDLS